ncbi:MAG TPA: radical SAM protein [Bryobacteraceae bacterium]
MNNQEQATPQGRAINWVIKLSKLCNLRCGYCYEWNELDNPRRMSAELIERVVQAAADLHRMRLRTTPAVRTTLIMHGGEPLVLPPDYLKTFLELTRTYFAGLFHEVALQSNLYRITREQIDLLKEYKVGLGVSYDVAPGVRLTVNGQESEQRVEENIRLVRGEGIPLAAIVVIGKHSAPSLRTIYDHFAERGMMLRVLPLADGPPERPIENFWISLEETIAAMCDLFDYWFDTGLRVAIDPFRIYVKDAIRFLLGASVQKYDRRAAGDFAFFVNVDGRLYAERDAYHTPRALGDLNTERIGDVLRSSAYQASLAREAALIAGKCPTCPLDKTCAGWPIVSTKSRGQFDNPCAIAPAVIQHIAMRFESWGFGREELQRMLQDLAAAPQYAQA